MAPPPPISQTNTHKRPLSPAPSSQSNPPHISPHLQNTNDPNTTTTAPTASTPTLPPFLNPTSLTLRRKFHALQTHESHLRTSPSAVYTHPLAHPRNRYPSILPWAHNRVLLRSLPFPYINASPITLNHGSEEERGNERYEERYIACQGPKEGEEGGSAHFWEMCWQEGARVVVMLTQAVEEGREKCAVYYPEMEGEVLGLGRWGSVECVGLKRESCTEVRELRVVRYREKEVGDGDGDGNELGNVNGYGEEEGNGEDREEQVRIVWHFLFLGWPDMEVPSETDEFLGLIKMTRFKIDQVPQDAGKEQEQEMCGPRIVHCSAGVGRTGTFIALDHLLRRFDDGELDIVFQQSRGDRQINSSEEFDPVFETVKRLREQRMHMVYQPAQFAFIYQVLKEKWLAREKGLGTPRIRPVDLVEEGSPTKKRKSSMNYDLPDLMSDAAPKEVGGM